MENRDRKFITTESQDLDEAQQQVWDAVKQAFSDRDCIGYWRYPIFAKVGEQRKEPDILIVDRELGIIVIETVAVTVAQIAAIDESGAWEMVPETSFSHVQAYPLAEQQLRSIIGVCDRDARLWRKVNGRALLSLPLIAEQQWQERSFHEHPHCPPIVFQDQLSAERLRDRIQQTSPLIPGEQLDDEQWEALLTAISGTSILRKATLSRFSKSGKTRAAVLEILRENLYELDLQQEHIGKEIAPGLQRIRGIAGSGKTVLLCQKAANMHLKHPDWDIALVFFSRTLYDQIISLIDRWLRRFSNGEVQYDPNTNSKLRVLHAWGAFDRPGFYSTICQNSGIRRRTVEDTQHKKNPTWGLAELCKWLLEDSAIAPMFDAILIDEGQDLITDEELKYRDKQAIYWLAYKALRPIDTDNPEQRRLVWAYDEAQSLDTLKIPSTKELFGSELSSIFAKGSQYKGGIKKSEIMRRCYRTPGSILTAAHALGMGLLRSEGMLSGITNKEDWSKIGYEVTGNFKQPGSEIVLHRPSENSPNPIEELWEEPVLEFETYDSREEELEDLVRKISFNLNDEDFKASREILVIVLGAPEEAVELENQVACFLIDRGIRIYIATALELDRIKPKHPDRDPDRFWMEGGVTISRVSRAKGNEADLVYVVGCDRVARKESDLSLRNQLFIALTRSRGWAVLSGVGDYLFYNEVRDVIASETTLKFTYQRPLQRNLDEEN
ncbi:MAG: ATP-binding domain-containing protein [Cyanobacteriota bacterium]|nr:ATP-binding domain-containing protein [Cyanobacteriota bacterium]